MKKIILFMGLVSSFIAFSQESDNTYVFLVEITNRGLAPQFEKQNNSFVYTGEDSKEKKFFSNYTVLDFFQTFPDSRRERTLNIYTFVADNENFMNELLFDFPDKYIGGKDVSDFKVELQGSYPNDYGTTSPFPNLGADVQMKNFDYIGLPKAWDYTFGNSDILIGISDAKIDTTHVDFKFKTTFLQRYYDVGYHNLPYDPNNINSTHGTTVAGTAVAQGNNGSASVGVCSDCGIVANAYSYGNPGTYINPTPNLNSLLQLAIAGAKVINMSWGSFSTNTNYDYYQWIMDELHDDYNVVLVAAAGNKNPFKEPELYEQYNYMLYHYPASFNHVISVTGVHHRNIWGEEIVNLPNWGEITRFTEDMIADSVVMDYQGNGPYGFVNSSWHTVNDKVDICAPHWTFLYSRFLGENIINYGGATSNATPHVTGTVGLMFSLNPCLINDEIEAILKLTSKNLERIPGNGGYTGRIGSGKLETGKAVEFVYEMMSPNGNAVIDGQYFYRFNFNLSHINNKLTIINQVFEENSTADFTAKNEIEILPDTDLRPNAYAYLDLQVDNNIDITCELEERVFIKRNKSVKEQSDVIDKESVKLYPNPNNGQFEIITNYQGNIDVEVYDLYGKVILKENAIKSSSFSIDCSHLPSGIYIVKLYNSSSSEILKFIKH